MRIAAIKISIIFRIEGIESITNYLQSPYDSNHSDSRTFCSELLKENSVENQVSEILGTKSSGPPVIFLSPNSRQNAIDEPCLADWLWALCHYLEAGSLWLSSCLQAFPLTIKLTLTCSFKIPPVALNFHPALALRAYTVQSITINRIGELCPWEPIYQASLSEQKKQNLAASINKFNIIKMQRQQKNKWRLFSNSCGKQDFRGGKKAAVSSLAKEKEHCFLKIKTNRRAYGRLRS